MTLQLPYVPVVHKSCCCTLRTGSLFLGWLAMISTVCKFVLIFMVFLNLPREENEKENVVRTIALRTPFTDGTKWLNANPEFFLASLSIAAVICSIEAIFIIMLLNGIHNEKPSLMQPYLLCIIFVLMSTLLGNVIFGIYYAVINIFAGLMIIAFTILGSSIGLYVWSILYSHYQELEQKKSANNIKYEEFDVNKKVIL